MLATGRTFYKMSGSGNDFIVMDAMREAPGDLLDADVVLALCARATGIGADGIVFIVPSNVADFGIIYLNSDGSPANLCGNASLCSARLAAELGIVGVSEFRIETGAGVLGARVQDGTAEVDLPSVNPSDLQLPIRLEPGERWMGFTDVGVPHLTIRVAEVAEVDVVRRGQFLRQSSLFSRGVNVNFVSADGADGWNIRTYERGVEGETLACGTGSIATAIQLTTFGELVGATARLLTRSGKTHRVRLRGSAESGWLPSLSGDSRLVFEGRICEFAG